MERCLKPVAELLLNLGYAGAEIAPVPDQPGMIRYRPELEPKLAESLVQHKLELLALMAHFVAAGAEAEYVLNERLGIAIDLGLTIHPGSMAWLIAVGEALLVTSNSQKSEVGSSEDRGRGDVVLKRGAA